MLNRIRKLQPFFCLGLAILGCSCFAKTNENTQKNKNNSEIVKTKKRIDMEKEEKNIKKVFVNYVDFWNKHEIDNWGSLFTQDTRFITWSGGKYNSNKENIENHKKAHEKLKIMQQNMTYHLKDIEVKFLENNIALVYATWVWTDFKSDEKIENRSGYLTMVLVKSDKKWLIKTTQNTRIDKTLH